jgi:hypothetical protein
VSESGDIQTRQPTSGVFHSLDGFGGYLRCTVCDSTADLGEPSERQRRGWPTCCGYTMRWCTQAQIDRGEEPRRG